MKVHIGNAKGKIVIFAIDSWNAISTGSTGMKKRFNEEKRVKIGERVVLVRRGKKSIWHMEFHYKGHRHKTTRTANLKFARRCAIKLEAQLIEGAYQVTKKTPTPTRKTAIIVAIDEFVRYHKTEGSRPKTYIRYRGILWKFKDFLKQNDVVYLEDIDIRFVDRYRESRKPEVGATSMHKEGTTIKRFLNWCVERNLVETNPLKETIFRKPKTKVNKVLTLDQVNLILGSATKLRFAVFAMLAFTGMRVSELRNLLVEDVDFESNWIYIRSRVGFENKTGEDWQVPIHPRLGRILLELEVTESGWFFTALQSTKYPNGDHHINPKRINEEFRAVLEKLDIPSGRAEDGFTTHSLRHFFKTFCINSKVPKPVVDEWQGHELRGKASDQYFHLSDEDSQRHMKDVPFGTDD